MRLAIRVDVSEQIGAGHLMRCLAFASVSARLGAECFFLVRSPTATVRRFIQDAGHQLLDLADDTSQPLDSARDAEQTLVRLAQLPSVDWLVVDHYALGMAWESVLRPSVQHLMVIDDLTNRAHDCDLLLNQNSRLPEATGGGPYDTLVPKHCRLLMGPQFAILRPEFKQLRASRPERDGRVRRILVFFGSGDPSGETLRTLRVLQNLGRGEIAVDVVSSMLNPALEKIRTLCAAFPGCRLHVDAREMAALMLQADLAIGAAGSACWERACLGLPSITIAVAANQLPGAEALAREGVHLYLGPTGAAMEPVLADAVRLALSNPALLNSLSVRSRAVCDGGGAWRVASALGLPAVTVRPASMADCDFVFEWRNAPSTREFFFDPAPLRLEDHRHWFDRSLADPARVILIGRRNEDSADFGVLRYDLREEIAEVSIYLAPGATGRGLGPRLLEEGRSWLEQHHPEIREIHARVIPSNQASISAFKAAEFVPAYAVMIRTLGRPMPDALDRTGTKHQ